MRTFTTRTRTNVTLTALLMTAGLIVVSAPTTARAQSGNTAKPMANVLLLIDTSGSMERMPDNSLPSQNRDPLNPSTTLPIGAIQNACSAGVESNPNRWGMLLQALTGNFSPFYSCDALDRTNVRFKNEYKIGGNNPIDADYTLPYHRPLTGITANACAIAPYQMPGTTAPGGVGPSGLGLGGDVTDFPEDALATVTNAYANSRYAGPGAGSAFPTPYSAIPAANQCIFDQVLDGQLDAARDYIRLSLMTFDSATDPGTGVTNPTGYPLLGSALSGASQPFKGEWSYLRSPGNPAYSAAGAAGNLPGCAAIPFEVGARHWGAPPWEGRMVLFPKPDASLFDVQRSNEEIQKVLLSSRPYGATPIDGMMDDAKDYYWYKNNGPKDDLYVTSDCRDQYIVLLTDGAPNMDLRPGCQTGTGTCPYGTSSAQTALDLYNATNGKKVATYVIGFSVNGSGTVPGDGFPPFFQTAPLNTCKDFYAGAAANGGGNGNPTDMATACNALTPPGGADGSTAQACCKLNEIAYNGSGGATGTKEGPFFAESQADIVLSFGKILAAITKSVSTRTLPGFTPTAFSNASFATPTSAQFVGSFVPNAQKPWSGELLRDRFKCESVAACTPGPSPCPNPQTNSTTAGDSTAVNLAVQTATNRLFITVTGDELAAPATPPLNLMVDSQRTLRPFSAATGTPAPDGIIGYQGKEWAAPDWTLAGASTPVSPPQDFRLALDIDKNTCKKTKVIKTGTSVGARGTTIVPALDLDDGTQCSTVMWGFETAHSSAISLSGTPASAGVYNFNIRCNATGALAASKGRCSITGTICDVANPTTCVGASEPVGQTCVPDCSAFGAVFRASPTVMGPPNGFLRDSGYRTFAAKRAQRRPMVFAATTDGILHALKAVEDQPGAHHELWSFVPPAVLPRIATNYPSGNQVLLDGTPVIADVVWDRASNDTDVSATPGSKWHSSLVAGLGEGGGYYSLNVTDADCNDPAAPNTGTFSNVCLGGAGWQQATSLAGASAGAEYDGLAKKGPHFMWQLGDVPQGSAADPAKVVRKARDGKKMVALFGRHTGTPAITTLQMKIAGVERQIGVAILPGGVDGPPESTGSCPRSLTPAVHDATPSGYRSTVRKWAKDVSGACTGPVPGRGVSIVRLDTGEIIRHWGRQQDVPEAIWAQPAVAVAAPFDSPMIGTPVVYPQITGAVAQKIFVGDADGAVWRIDVSNTDPALWKVALFADLIPSGAGEAAASQPIQVPPAISLDVGGAIVLHVATGDQESIVHKTGELNYLWSLKDPRPTTAGLTKAVFNWKLNLTDGERVTGPMAVFDRAIYFATFLPTIPANGTQCANIGQARLWGLHYTDPAAPAGTGGLPAYCKKANLGSDGICGVGAMVQYEQILDLGGNIVSTVVPGVALRASQPCAAQGVLADEGTGSGFSSVTPSQFQLVFGIPKQNSNAATFPPSAQVGTVNRPLPRISTRIEAWSFVTD